MTIKIDVAAHIMTPKFHEALCKIQPEGYPDQRVQEANETMYDLESRFRIMDEYPDYRQILSMPGPSLTADFVSVEQARDLAKLANDELAGLIQKYPDYFVAGVAILPIIDIDSSLREIERSLNQLGLRGILLQDAINGNPLDSEQFIPIYEMMMQYNLPIWIHPNRERTFPDYKSESTSKYAIFSVLGWPYGTSVAMTRLVLSGIMENYPGLKFITHHCGGMIPYFAKRIDGAYDFDELRMNLKYKSRLRGPLMDYFKRFYNDCALYGSTPGLMCAYDFFGAEKMLFGTDWPFDSEMGAKYVRETINSIEKMDIPEFEKHGIFEKNVRRLIRLST